MTPREFAIKIILDSFGDDLERAESAFRNCTDAQLDQRYGQSDSTRRQILEGYRAARARRAAALAWAEGVD